MNRVRAERLGHRPGLDSLRGVAVLMVMTAHSLARPEVAEAGGVGVTMFFVLSGFLITALLLEEREDAGTLRLDGFYARRARRLLPALGLLLPLAALVNMTAGLWVLRPVVSTVTYTANYSSAGHDREFGAFSHLWSLAVEEHFYVLWPLVVLVLARRHLAWVCAAGIVVVPVLRWFVSFDDPSLAYRATHLRIDALLVGCLLAAVGMRWRPKGWLVWASGLVLAVTCHQAFAPTMVRWWLLPVAGASAVLVASASRWRRVPWLGYVGSISYGLYLVHVPIGWWLRVEGVTGQVELLVATFAMSFVLAAASYRWVEAPVRRWRSGRPRRVAGAGAGDPTRAPGPRSSDGFRSAAVG